MKWLQEFTQNEELCNLPHLCACCQRTILTFLYSAFLKKARKWYGKTYFQIDLYWQESGVKSSERRDGAAWEFWFPFCFGGLLAFLVSHSEQILKLLRQLLTVLLPERERMCAWVLAHWTQKITYWLQQSH